MMKKGWPHTLASIEQCDSPSSLVKSVTLQTVPLPAEFSAKI